MAVTALVVAILSGLGTIASAIISQRSIKHVRNQANLALSQHHSLRTPQWGEADLVEIGDDSWEVHLPLISDTPLDSVQLEVIVGPGQTPGLHLRGSAEGALNGLELGGTATWRLGVNQQGDPTTRVRIASTAGKEKWSTLITLPLSAYGWERL